MIPRLAHLVDCTTIRLISKITSYLGQKPNISFSGKLHLISLCVRGLMLFYIVGPLLNEKYREFYLGHYLELGFSLNGDI